MSWAVTWLGFLGKPLWVVADGAYAKAPFLKPMRSLGVTVVTRTPPVPQKPWRAGAKRTRAWAGAGAGSGPRLTGR